MIESHNRASIGPLLVSNIIHNLWGYWRARPGEILVVSRGSDGCIRPRMILCSYPFKLPNHHVLLAVMHVAVSMEALY